MSYAKMKVLHPSSMIALLILCSLFSINQRVASAQDNKLSEIQEKMKSKLSEYQENSKEEAVAKKLEDINKNLRQEEAELKNYGSQLSQTQSEIQKLSEEVNQLTAKLESNIEYLRSVIIAFYKQQYDSNALILLSADDNQDMIQKMKYASLLAHYDSTVINQYGAEVRKINDKKQQMAALQKTLREGEENARIKRNKINEEGLKKAQLLAELKAKRVMYEAKIREFEASSGKIQVMLADIKSKELPKSIQGNGFISLKGNLSWPVDGELVPRYDKNSELPTGTSALKSGIEIKAKPESEVEAVAGGRVVYTGIYEGYGFVVIIDHGDGYHTLYGNISEISLAKGNIVIQGSRVGRPVKSMTLNVPSLYFEIRYKGRPVDPMGWLQKKGRKVS
ncbi:MAG: peptidoglycan DD-metalloendopeptidase family protein [Nitrospirae bacterium]|nr:peptidoglycan DD-metalloendopeptidase family protein [Nitrospirota bacterium]